MGVFQDLFDFAKALDKENPLEANRRIVSGEFIELFDKYGDLDYPDGLTDRPALALLYLLGVIGKPIPEIGLSGPITGTLSRGDNANAPKEATIRWLAFESAIENENPQLEKSILEAIGYDVLNPNAFSNAPPPEGGIPWTPCSLTYTDYVHRWSADEQLTLRNDDLVTRVVDGGSGGIDLVAPVGEESSFIENSFGGKPGFSFKNFSKSRLESESNVTLFPNKRGTILWVTRLKNSFSFSQKQMIKVAASSNETFLYMRADESLRPWAFSSVADVSGVNLQTPPPDQYPQNVSQLHSVRRSTALELRSRVNNGDDKITVIGDYVSVPGLFRCGKAGDNINQYIEHELAIILVFDYVLNPARMDVIEQELMACYGVAS